MERIDISKIGKQVIKQKLSQNEKKNLVNFGPLTKKL